MHTHIESKAVLRIINFLWPINQTSIKPMCLEGRERGREGGRGRGREARRVRGRQVCGGISTVTFDPRVATHFLGSFSFTPPLFHLPFLPPIPPSSLHPSSHSPFLHFISFPPSHPPFLLLSLPSSLLPSFPLVSTPSWSSPPLANPSFLSFEEKENRSPGKKLSRAWSSLKVGTRNQEGVKASSRGYTRAKVKKPATPFVGISWVSFAQTTAEETWSTS